jgi:hypothetical protein
MCNGEVICEAIRGKNLLRFNYQSHDRIVEPHLLGQDSSGNEILSGYLVGGSVGPLAQDAGDVISTSLTKLERTV